MFAVVTIVGFLRIAQKVTTSWTCGFTSRTRKNGNSIGWGITRSIPFTFSPKYVDKILSHPKPWLQSVAILNPILANFRSLIVLMPLLGFLDFRQRFRPNPNRSSKTAMEELASISTSRSLPDSSSISSKIFFQSSESFNCNIWLLMLKLSFICAESSRDPSFEKIFHPR